MQQTMMVAMKIRISEWETREWWIITVLCVPDKREENG